MRCGRHLPRVSCQFQSALQSVQAGSRGFGLTLEGCRSRPPARAPRPTVRTPNPVGAPSAPVGTLDPLPPHEWRPSVKVGRPAKNPAERRSEVIRVRLTPDEMDQLSLHTLRVAGIDG